MSKPAENEGEKRRELQDATPIGGLLGDLIAAKAELEARNASLQLVNDLTLRLQRRLDVGAIAAETVDALSRSIHAPLVAFYLLDGPAGPLRMAAGHGFTEAELQLGETLPLEGSASGRAVREQRIVTIGEVKKNGRDVHPVVRALEERDLSSGLCVPLTYAGTPLGTVNLLFSEGREMRPLEVETFQGVARAVSLAVANARHVADLEHLAFHDPLTGLANRAGLHRRVAEIAAGTDGGSAALVLVDLVRFREINDTLGHVVGDELLVHVATRLRERSGGRPSDVFRLSGDEFALVVPGVDDPAAAVGAGRRVLGAFDEPVKIAGLGLGIGANVGVATYPSQARDSHELLRCADVALHRAKTTGGGLASYAREMDERTPERLAILSELARAIREGELVLHFQPKVALQYGFVEGFEALVRWMHPRLGLLAPGRFVPVAEATDVIQPLTTWVVRNALEQLARWNGAFPRLTMAVNLSMRNLLDRSCPERFEEIVREVGVNPQSVEYELTETAIMADPESALEALRRITASGPRLAVDDFGTGYSSLSYLKRLPVDVLKIDRSFVADMDAGERGLTIVRSTVQLAHSLDLGVVAEGVESRESARTLRSLKCDFAQGSYVAMPEPAEEAGRHLARGGWLDVPL